MKHWAHFLVLAEVDDCVFTVGAFVSLDLLLYPFLCQRHDSYIDALGILQVLLLLDNCSASLQIGLDTQPV